ncbi:MAG: prolyl oligopeptidase family serine peptidase, partial [Planctomycetes bacterium]|nr:prolyl oligopeptidase family serine peptidase [Planctomycetota bacterium]
LPPPHDGKNWIVHLHGHGSSGDQPYTREDIRTAWLEFYLEHHLGVLSPNLRGNAWMCHEAVEDLHCLLHWVRNEYGAASFYFVSGSMGGTGNLIYSMLHPEDVAATVALCPVTDIASYHQWCCQHPGGVRDEIRAAIETAYTGSPAAATQRYAEHIVTENADRLTMPLYLAHATGDDVIPVQQSQALFYNMKNAQNMTYHEIENGGHDTPLHDSRMLQWLDKQIK